MKCGTSFWPTLQPPEATRTRGWAPTARSAGSWSPAVVRDMPCLGAYAAELRPQHELYAREQGSILAPVLALRHLGRPKTP